VEKIFLLRIWKRIYLKRLDVPIIYNILSLFVFIFGSFLKKINYNLVTRQLYAFSLKEAFKRSTIEKVKKILITKFGVTSCTRLFNLAYISKKLSNIYKTEYDVIGFDSGKEMSKPTSYRDQPEKYRFKDFPSLGLNNKKMPLKTKMYIGLINKTYKFIKNNLKKI